MNSMKKGKDITSTIIVVVFMGLMICSIFAIKADASPLTIGGVTFELGETAFADVVHIVEGYVGGHNCDAGGAGGKIENVLGADTSTCIGDHCQSDHSGLIFDVLFTDNVIINGEGNDLAIFELAYYDGFGVAIFDSATGSFTDYQRFVPQETIDHPVGVVLIDLNNFGFEAGAIVDKIRINTYMLTPGDPVADQAEIAAIGAINSVVPEITIAAPSDLGEEILKGTKVLIQGTAQGVDHVDIHVKRLKPEPVVESYKGQAVLIDGSFKFQWDTAKAGTLPGEYRIIAKGMDKAGTQVFSDGEPVKDDVPVIIYEPKLKFTIIDGSGWLTLYEGSSGTPWEAISGNNNIKDQRIACKGPIPEGRWEVGKSSIGESEREGPWRFPLTSNDVPYLRWTKCECEEEWCNKHPDRGDMLIHGGPWGITWGCIRLHNNDLEKLRAKLDSENGIRKTYKGPLYLDVVYPTQTAQIKIRAYSPIDLSVTDPDGLITGLGVNEIPGATYTETDINGDGDPDDLIGFTERKIGKYLISVIPEPNASPTATYTLEVLADDTTIILAENVQISSIPSQPYMIRSTENLVIQIIPATIDLDPDTLNLQSKGKWVTTYIELREGYDASNIDVSTIILNDEVQAENNPTEIGDYDSDSIADLMVKFDRSAVQEILEVGDEVEIKVAGELTDGTPFEGSDTIRVIDKGKGG